MYPTHSSTQQNNFHVLGLKEVAPALPPISANLDGRWQSDDPYFGGSTRHATYVEQEFKNDEFFDIFGGSPPVDLSSLGGNEMLHTTSIPFISQETVNPPREKPVQSYSPIFLPQPDWKPVTMRLPYLCVLIVIALGLAALQEFLYQYSSRRGGLITYESVNDLSVGQYFLWRYAPTLALVIYGLMVEATDFEMKKLQPYYLMARKEGASAEESVLLEPLSLWTYLTNPRLLGIRIFATETMTLLATLAVPTLQNASLSTTQDLQLKQHLVVNNVWSRLLTCALCLLALSILSVLVLNARDRSGLFATPRGIVGTAKMVNRSHILMIGKGLENAGQSKVREVLSKQRFFLQNGGMHIEDVPSDSSRAQVSKAGDDHPHPSMLSSTYLLSFEAFLVVVVVLLAAVLFTKANSVLQSVPLLTALGVVIKLVWTMIDESVRLMEPFHTLSLRHAPSRVLFLDYTGTSTIAMPFKAAQNWHWLLFFISINSILVEVLTVCLSSFKAQASNFRHRDGSGGTAGPSEEETFTSFWVSLGLSIFILTTLGITAAIICWRRRHPFMAQLPGTIATSMIMMHQSKFIYDMVGTEKMTVKMLEKKLSGLYKTYGFGWMIGRDGERHVGVDEEELLATYKYMEYQNELQFEFPDEQHAEPPPPAQLGYVSSQFIPPVSPYELMSYRASG